MERNFGGLPEMRLLAVGEGKGTDGAVGGLRPLEDEADAEVCEYGAALQQRRLGGDDARVAVERSGAVPCPGSGRAHAADPVREVLQRDRRGKASGVLA